jgi:hypothetical protein
MRPSAPRARPAPTARTPARRRLTVIMVSSSGKFRQPMHSTRLPHGKLVTALARDALSSLPDACDPACAAFPASHHPFAGRLQGCAGQL